MAISVLSAAKRIGRRSGWSLSNLELQKLIYLAHMFYLGRTGNPLVNGNFEAWDYGPVHPDLYHRAKIFGSEPVQDIFFDVSEPGEGSPERAILDEAFDSIGKVGPSRLVNATHRPGGAWATYYIPGARRRVIPNPAILDEYQKLDGHVDAAPAA